MRWWERMNPITLKEDPEEIESTCTFRRVIHALPRPLPARASQQAVSPACAVCMDSSILAATFSPTCREMKAKTTRSTYRPVNVE